MTCRDCIHYDVCEITITDESFTDDAPQELRDMFSPKGCETFRNKADYAEVVRCEKCKYRTTHTCAITGIKTLFCEYGEKPFAVEPTHYCGYGETKHT